MEREEKERKLIRAGEEYVRLIREQLFPKSPLQVEDAVDFVISILNKILFSEDSFRYDEVRPVQKNLIMPYYDYLKKRKTENDKVDTFLKYEEVEPEEEMEDGYD